MSGGGCDQHDASRWRSVHRAAIREPGSTVIRAVVHPYHRNEGRKGRAVYGGIASNDLDPARHAPAPGARAGSGAGSSGRRAWTRVPSPTRLDTVSSPACRLTTDRAIDIPSPVPSGLVVKNRSNARASVSSVMPGPVSSMVTVTVPVAAEYAVATVSRP